ncbi:MAG: helix-turn-helix transcriptional regulator [Planctomycetia bacterium]|nr:helix-turn-helix transcriptional regulator [Planctomycetia bacterium]
MQYTHEFNLVKGHDVIDAPFLIAYVIGMGQLSNKLREAIRNSGATQMEIAQAVGISDGIISRFMREERSMNLETAEKLAGHFGLELREVPERRSRR